MSSLISSHDRRSELGRLQVRRDGRARPGFHPAQSEPLRWRSPARHASPHHVAPARVPQRADVSSQLSGVADPRVPADAELLDVAIHLLVVIGLGAFGEPAGAEQFLDLPSAHLHLPLDGPLAMALPIQFQYLLKPHDAFGPPVERLLLVLGQCHGRQLGHGQGHRRQIIGRKRIHRRLGHILGHIGLGRLRLRGRHRLGDRRMMSIKNPHQSLPAVGQQVPSIGDLCRIGRAGGNRRRVDAGPIAGYDGWRVRARGQPGFQRGTGPVRQQIDHIAGLMVDDDRAVTLAAAESKVVDANDAPPLAVGWRRGPKSAQDRVAAGVDAEFAAEPSAWFAATFQTDLHERLVEARRSAGVPSRQVRQLLSKDASPTVGVVTEEAARGKPQDHRCPAPGQVAHDADVAAVNTARRSLTDRAGRPLGNDSKLNFSLRRRDAQGFHHDTVGGGK